MDERNKSQLAKGKVVVRVKSSDSLAYIFLSHQDLLVFCWLSWVLNVPQT